MSTYRVILMIAGEQVVLRIRADRHARVGPQHVFYAVDGSWVAQCPVLETVSISLA